MIERFPLLQQPPGSNSCLPTAVRAVLLWQGMEEAVSTERISELCEESELGCDLDTALRNLRQEFTVDELTGDEEIIRATVTDPYDPQPVIMTLRYNVEVPLTHAVVLIAIRQQSEAEGTQEIVEFMDPITGKIEQDASGVFWQHWNLGWERAFTIQP